MKVKSKGGRSIWRFNFSYSPSTKVMEGEEGTLEALSTKLWKMKEEHLKPYQQYLLDLTKTFEKIEYIIIPRAQNHFAEASATLVSIVEILKGVWT